MAQNPGAALMGIDLGRLQEALATAIQSGRDESAGLIDALKSQRNTALDHSAVISVQLAAALKKVSELEAALREESLQKQEALDELAQYRARDNPSPG